MTPETAKPSLVDKSFYFGNAKGEAMPLSVEEAFSRGLTDFRGWYCAIGVENLHISPDGALYGGACRNSGHLGNIYERSFHQNGIWHACSRRVCSCGADMQVRKVKYKSLIPETYKDIPQQIVGNIQNATYTAPVHQEMHRRYPLTLTWDLGRRCNYSCSYCHPKISNNYEAHRTWGSLMFAWEGLNEYFLKGRKAKFVFTGGEPTINPMYFEFVKLLTDEGHQVHTTTNGSRLPEYYADLIERSLIGFSYHLEFAQIEKFVKVLEAIIERKQISEKARLNWCGVRVMVPPGALPKALAARDAILAVPGLKEAGILMFFSSCYDRAESTRMMSYEPGELDQIAQLG